LLDHPALVAQVSAGHVYFSFVRFESIRGTAGIAWSAKMDRKYNGGPGDCENAESKKGWLTFYDKKSLTERSAWYSASGQNYARYRPRYPQDVIDAVIQLTGLKKGICQPFRIPLLCI
jgi:hypothetical protein